MTQSFQYYRTCCIASGITLPLPRCTLQGCEVSLVIGPNPFPTVVFHEEHYRLPDDTIQITVAQDDIRYRLCFPEMAEFWIDAAVRQVVAQAQAGVTSETLAHLFVDQVMPRFLSTLGHTALHTSGAIMDDQAILFLGHSGWGKSTLAAEFHFNGYAGISDDVIFIEHVGKTFLAVQSYPGFRLWPDIASRYESSVAHLAPVAHYYAKQRIVTNTQTQSMPIQCAFLIASPDQADDHIQIEPLDPMKAFWILTEQSFRLMPHDTTQIQREFALFSDLAASIPFFSLSYPRHLASLPAVRERILDHVAGLE
jgi:hypothetical protein